MIREEMEQNKIKNKEILYMGIMYVVLLTFKLIFVIGNRSFPIISDEFNYEFMSWQLTERGMYESTHYPLLYPLLLTPAHLFGDNSYIVMKILNAVYSSFVPVIAYKICRLYVGEKPSLACAVFTMLIPYQYIIPMCLMSENIYFSLFLLAIYLYLKPYKKNLYEDIAAAVSVGMLMLTRHITISLLPVFALLWLIKQIGKKEKFSRIILRGLAICAGIIIVYSPWLVTKLVQGCTLKSILGFGIASKTNPEQLTMSRFALSFAYYFFYAALMAAPFLGVLVKSFRAIDIKKKERCSSYNQLWVMMMGMMAMLLIAATRHSWRAYYNYPEFTKMKGRYVLYVAVLAAILSTVTLFYKKPKFKHPWCNILLCYVIPVGILLCAYMVEIAGKTSISVGSLIDMYDSIDGRRIYYGGKIFFAVAVISMIGIQAVYDFGKERLKSYLTLIFVVGIALTEMVGALEYYQKVRSANITAVEDGVIKYERAIMEDLKSIDCGRYEIVYMEAGVRRTDIVEWLPKFARLTNFMMTEDAAKISADDYYVLTIEPEKYAEVLLGQINVYTFNNRDIYLLHIENVNSK